jgi:hypothetical protein
MIAALLACTGTPSPPGNSGDTGETAAPVDVADYRLKLNPSWAENQDPLAGVDAVSIFIEQDGEETEVPLTGVASGGTATGARMPALDEAMIRLEARTQGVLSAWGRTGPVSATTGEVAADILLLEPGAVAQFPELENEDGVLGLWKPVLAGLGSGEFLLLGGGYTSDNGRIRYGSDLLWHLALDGATSPPSFEVLGELPTMHSVKADDEAGRIGATFTEVGAGSAAGKWLLIGGAFQSPLGNPDTMTWDSFLYDVEEGTWSDVDEDQANGMALHQAVTNKDGDVVVWGGVQYDSGQVYINSEVTRFRADKLDFASVGVNYEMGTVDAPGVAIGGSGVLICGGLNLTEAGQFVAVDVCVRATLGGDVETAATLPAAVAGHSMLALADGRVLLSGGAPYVYSASEPYAGATADIWLYDPSVSDPQWEAFSSMRQARAGHEMLQVTDNLVLIVGGSEEYGADTLPEEASSCVELLNLETATTSMYAGCTGDSNYGGLTTRAYQPGAAMDADWGALIVGGSNEGQLAQSEVNLYFPPE